MDIPRKRTQWRWFAVGFAVVFFLFLIFFRLIAMHPSGEYAVRQPLWKFYANTLPKLFGMSALGPASGNTGILPSLVFWHLALSAIGGFAALGIDRLFRRRAK